MNFPDSKDISTVHQYIEEIELPEAPVGLEAVGTPTAMDADLVVVGSQLMEFDPAIAADVKGAISNSALLSQLAANQATAQDGDPIGWYDTYASTLGSLGWVQTERNFVEHEVNDTGVELHEAIIPVVTALLGPQVAAASAILAVLKGLKEMDEDLPWITVFNRESKRFQSHQFQLSFAALDKEGDPQVSLVCFTLEVNKDIVQVLFFKFSDASAVLKKGDTTLTMNRQVLASIQGALAAKLAQYISSFIKEVDIG